MHTQGKWRIETLSKLHGEFRIFTNGDSEEDDNPKVIADIAGGLGVVEDACLESQDNARLIVAAPELLRELKRLANAANAIELAYSKGYAVDDYVRQLGNMLNIVYTTIHKAERGW